MAWRNASLAGASRLLVALSFLLRAVWPLKLLRLAVCLRLGLRLKLLLKLRLEWLRPLLHLWQKLPRKPLPKRLR